MGNLRKAIAVSLLAAAVSLRAGAEKVDNTPVAEFDLKRYMGEWYEVARLDNYIERGIEHAKAKYSQKADGTLEFVTTCIKDGKAKKAVGKGKLTDTPGLMRVSFVGPFYSDYRVLMVDTNYTYALVGGGSADYLWLLSRTPVLSGEAKSALLEEAKRRGYDVSALVWVKHDTDEKPVPRDDVGKVSDPKKGRLYGPVRGNSTFRRSDRWT